MEEVDTYDLLDKLAPVVKGRCRKGLKRVGSTCCERRAVVEVKFDERVGTAISRASNFVGGRHQRLAEVKVASKAVRDEFRKQERARQ